MKIRVKERNVYGTDLLYPVSPGAEILAKLVGKKTLNLEHLKAARALGHTISVESTARPETLATVAAINAEGEEL